MYTEIILAGLATGTAIAATKALKNESTTLTQYSPLVKNAASFIAGFEGFRSEAYNKDGHWTIGYGHTKGVQPGDTCTRAEAEQMLASDCLAYMNDVVKKTKDCEPTLTDNQKIALCSLSYNIGMGNFASSTLLKVVKKDPYDPDIRNQFAAWRKSNGVVQQGLVKRRTSEADRYFS